MDLHARACCTWLVIALGVALTAHAEESSPDSIATQALWGIQGLDATDLDADAGIVAELDGLLADPADLAAGEAHRLAALPWLDRVQVEALETATGLRSPEDVARLAGWDEETARAIAPFVRFTPSRRHSPLRASLYGTRTAVRLVAQVPGLSITARRPHDGDEPGATLRVGSSRWTATAGDFRCGLAQGLLTWGSSGGVRSGDSVVRRTRGVVPLGDPTALHALRGLGLEMRAGGWRVMGLSAQCAAGRARLVACSGPLGAGSWIGVASAVGEIRAASLGYEVARPDRSLALEVAGDAQRRTSAAAGAMWRARSLVIGAHVGVSPAGPLTSLATGTRSAASRHGLLQLRTRWRRGTVTASFLRAADESMEGSWSGRNDQQLVVTASGAGTALELRLRHSTTGTEAWCDAANREWREAERTGGHLRARRPLRPGWVAGADFQRTVARTQSRQEVHGEAWDLCCERVRGSVRPFVGAGIHRAPAGVELSESLPGSALGTIRLHGDALRLALGLRITWAALDAVGAAWVTSAPAAGVQCAVRGELTLRVR